MNKTILIIDETQRRKIARVVANAKENPYSLDKLKEIKARQRRPAGDDERFRIVIPVDHRVAFTFEEHPGGLARHISISLAKRPGRFPDQHSVAMILELFGFSPALYDSVKQMKPNNDVPGSAFWVEEQRALNFVEIINKE